MPRYIIMYNAGYGECYEEEECVDQKEADDLASQMWLEAAESQADYSATPWTAQDAYDYGLSSVDPSEEEE